MTLWQPNYSRCSTAPHWEEDDHVIEEDHDDDDDVIEDDDDDDKKNYLKLERIMLVAE